MKTVKTILAMTLVSTLVLACSNDDEAPLPVNEEETITTMTVTLVPQGGGTTVTLRSQDLDGDGPNAPAITISGPLAASTTYNGTIELLDETGTPAEDITEEVEAEGEEHQFFFTASGSIAEVDYADQDAGGNPVGIAFTLATSGAGSASLTITLRHEPKKPNDGTLADAGGETDIAQTFSLFVQ